jgi:integrase/recombinase XerD
MVGGFLWVPSLPQETTMTTEACLARLVRRDWLTDGPLNERITPYIEALQVRCYADGTIGAYLRCLAHFSHWLEGEELTAPSVDRALVEWFLRYHLPVCACPAPCRSCVHEMRAALHHLLAVLPGPEDHWAPMDSIASELDHFGDYLRDTCGLAPATCFYRTRHVGAFLASRFGSDAVQIEQLTAADMDIFLHRLAARWKPASCHVICTSLRSYLRYRAMLGDDTRILSETLPQITDSGRRHPPKVLSDIELDRFLHAFDRADPAGLRDYAIARCLVDLGLRGDEVTHLTLDALNWQSAMVTLTRTKSQRVQLLPLPVQTGDALAQYLHDGRPRTDRREVFVRHRAPFGVPLGTAAIRNAMNRAFVRSGLADRFCNTHVLRRSMATRLQKTGVPIKEIADVLRHRDLNTARVYARVDLERLRTVALPWPGGKS